MPSRSNALSIFKPVLCVGCLSIDLITMSAKFPKQNENELCLEAKWQRGGHSSNVSVVLRMLNCQVEFLGVLSLASILNGIIKEMEAMGIDLAHCPRTFEDPPYSLIMNSQKPACRSIINCNNNFPYVTFEDFQKVDIDNYGWVHFEASNFLETIKMMRSILDYNSGRTDRIGISLRVDEDYVKSIDLFNMCDYVVFSRHLATDLGWQTPMETCLELDKALRMPRSIHIKRPCFICPWTKEGAGCLDPQGNYTVQPAYLPKIPVDSYHVSECFTAAFIYACYVRQMNLANSVNFANRVTGYKVSDYGYAHLATLNTYPVTVIDADESIKTSKHDELQERVCQKYLNRVIRYSNGKYSTQLLGRDPSSLVETAE